MTVHTFWLVNLCFVLSVTARCPAGLIQGSMPDECFSFGTSLIWFDAQTHCLSLGGHLVIVRSAFTNAILSNLTNACGATSDTNMWLGATVGVFSTTWTWLDGSSITYSNWAQGRQRYPLDDNIVNTASKHLRCLILVFALPSRIFSRFSLHLG